MVTRLLGKLFGSRNDRLLKRMNKVVARINALEPSITALSDAELKAKTAEFRVRLEAGEKLDDLLPEAFAVVREAARRVLQMRHFDVQLVGGMALHEGKIAEMRTGEGKTLVATLAAYLNALPGHGVHIVTVNDYLARRDAGWMGQIYGFLGLTTGVVIPGMSAAQKREGYGADITYGTNNEYGFDYLRDNMAFRREEKMQRALHFAIVDEVDSILIDEARTPLIISGPTDDTSALYQNINALIPRFVKQEAEGGAGDFTVDEKTRQVHLTEAGHEQVERVLSEAGLLRSSESLYDAANLTLVHHLYAALRAHALYQRDVDYIVQGSQVVIVDEFTGRTMPGRRWSDGLHQAIEAKEGLAIQNENQTLASITFQNYFRLYGKLAGMTGTADTEAFEFQQIYNLEVMVIPTHRAMVRKDNGDVVYLTQPEKYQAILDDIKDCRTRGQPTLVGTASVEASEHLAKLLAKEKFPHEVLNAKQHEREAQIIVQAGRPGAVTIATNMAWRGTDIVLGGNLNAELAEVDAQDEVGRARVRAEWQKRHDQVVAAGGLHVIGTERHESRRIDNQLRGRSGRQGDPGSSRFYLSLEDNLMRIFASERVSALMQKLGMKEGEAIEHPWVSKAIENAQRYVEARNFDIRKHLLEFDNVANDQRKVIYEQRNELMGAEDVSEMVAQLRADVVNTLIDTYIPPESVDEQWDVAGLEQAVEEQYRLKLPLREWLASDTALAEEGLRQRIIAVFTETHQAKERQVGAGAMRQVEMAVMLQVVDHHWNELLATMDYLRQGIHLRSYAQRNPTQEFKREAFQLFSEMLSRIKHEVVGMLFRVQLRAEEDLEAVEKLRRSKPEALHFAHPEVEGLEGEPGAEAPLRPEMNAPFVRRDRKVGRNEPCPCGSGKKFKQCHGQLA